MFDSIPGEETLSENMGGKGVLTTPTLVHAAFILKANCDEWEDSPGNLTMVLLSFWWLGRISKGAFPGVHFKDVATPTFPGPVQVA